MKQNMSYTNYTVFVCPVILHKRSVHYDMFTPYTMNIIISIIISGSCDSDRDSNGSGSSSGNSDSISQSLSSPFYLIKRPFSESSWLASC